MSDLISRQAAIDAILHNQEVYSNNFGDDPIDKYTIAIIDNDAQTIAHLPSAERHGRWINDCNYSGWTCTNCYYHDGNMTDRYCSNCGAKMDEVLT